MKIAKISILILAAIMLIACGRSKDATFYLLAPIPPKKSAPHYRHLRLGIDRITTPSYIERPQLMIHDSLHQVEMKEYHQWAEAIDKNITRVVETNLATLLPGALVESSPWSSKFRPNYHLQIELLEFRVDIHGNSILRAEYLIYYEDQLRIKRDVYYRIKCVDPTIKALVISMNSNLTRLTRDIAHIFSTEHF